MAQSPLASHVALPTTAREKLAQDLNAVLATTLDLYLQVKQAHWNVKGPQFFARHELFDKVAEPLRLASDVIAERVSTLGGYAQGTLRLASMGSKLPEYDLKAESGQEHIRALVGRYAAFVEDVRSKIKHAEELHDPVTVDIYTEVLRKAELDMWFLDSHLISADKR